MSSAKEIRERFAKRRRCAAFVTPSSAMTAACDDADLLLAENERLREVIATCQQCGNAAKYEAITKLDGSTEHLFVCETDGECCYDWPVPESMIAALSQPDAGVKREEG